MAGNLAQASASLQSTTQDAQALRKVFETITAESCPRSFNFHMHTVYSDGKLRPEELIKQAIELGLKGLAITDHHHTGGYQAAQRWLSSNPVATSAATLPTLWSGIEINANLLDVEVHILGYAFDPNHESMAAYQLGHTTIGDDYQAENVIAAIHAAGGWAILAHPARYRRSPSELIPEAARFGIDGVEAYYAYSNPSPWHPSPRQTQEVKDLGDRHGLLSTCGTDTHGLSLLQRL
jgi:predicted metal-dependent phosphoesterase TrpH